MLLGTAFRRKLDAAVTLPSQGASSPLPAGRAVFPVTGGRTSIQAAGHGVAFAGGALKEGCGAVDEGAGLTCLCLRAPAVPKLGAHHQEALGGWLWGHQPRGHSMGGCQRAPIRPPGTALPHVHPLQHKQEHVCHPGKEAWRRSREGFSPEESVVLYADLPEPLG